MSGKRIGRCEVCGERDLLLRIVDVPPAGTKAAVCARCRRDASPGTAMCGMCGEPVRGIAATGGPAYCDEVCAFGAEGAGVLLERIGKQPRADFLVVASESKRGAVSLRDPDGAMTLIQERLTAAGFRPGDRVSIVLTAAVEEGR